MSDEGTQIVIDDVLDWRCQSCAVKPMLGQIGMVGGVYLRLRLSGRRSYTLYVIIDLKSGVVHEHCPVCHTWRSLHWDAERETIVETVSTANMPRVGCSCEHEQVREYSNGRK